MTDGTLHVDNYFHLRSVSPAIEVIQDPEEMRERAESARRQGLRIAVVPTMGALHEGHCSLVRLARSRGALVITTVFVNPTQFGAGEDYERYPRNLERDCALAGEAGTDVVFAPSREAMYPDKPLTAVTVEQITEILEGAIRPGHFRGVAPVVTKLLHLTRPHVVVFGQKDAQQVAVIKRMIRDLNFGVEVVVGPIVREPDGLALSSRNVYLTPRERGEAPALFLALQLGDASVRSGERNPETLRRSMIGLIAGTTSGAVQYVSIADPETLEEQRALAPGDRILISLAVRFGTTRLIDNCIVDVPA